MIDVIIPVYKGVRETRRCLDSVLRGAQREPLTVVVIDDASPEPGITAWLDDLASRDRIVLQRNGTNQGFVHSVNRGMALHGDRDVVLLNSDTEVTNNWLDRLHDHAYADADIGTVTPFSNNATICSYPFDGWMRGTPGTLGLAALDRLFAAKNAKRRVDIPTAVGFCMYVRRACLDRVGPFDHDRFGRGYGEENDFSLRAANAGWRNVLAGDLFVYHEGAVSFSGEREARAESASAALARAHPDYFDRIREFTRRAPLDPLREAIDNARVAIGVTEASHVVAEGAAHRAELQAQLCDLAGQVADMPMLREGLARADALVTERDLEITRLRAGLAHAEQLAFARESELRRLRENWLWKGMSWMARRKA